MLGRALRLRMAFVFIVFDAKKIHLLLISSFQVNIPSYLLSVTIIFTAANLDIKVLKISFQYLKNMFTFILQKVML